MTMARLKKGEYIECVACVFFFPYIHSLLRRSMRSGVTMSDTSETLLQKKRGALAPSNTLFSFYTLSARRAD